jgi:hypothetical protein
MKKINRNFRLIAAGIIFCGIISLFEMVWIIWYFMIHKPT